MAGDINIEQKIARVGMSSSLRKSMRNFCGVYKIVNSINNKFYIGSTNRLHDRYRQHTSKLRRGEHHSPYLQNSWKKYGESAFYFELLVACPKEYLIKLEQWFIDNLKPEYNISTKAHCPTVVQTSESIQKMLQTRQRKGITNAVAIYVYDQEGVFIKKFKKIEDAAIEIGINYSTILKSSKNGKYVRPNNKGNVYYAFRRNMRILKPFVPSVPKQRYKSTTKRPLYKKEKITNFILETYKDLDDCFLKTGIPKTTMSVKISAKAYKKTPYYFTYDV